MAATYTTDVPDWIPGAIQAAFYDTVGEPQSALTRAAFVFNDLNGRPGQEIKVPTALATTPADNLAETVPAVDDKLQSGAITLTVKEGVKSIAWSDRTQVQSGQDVNQLAGQRVGRAMLDRIELDLGAAAVAGRNTAADTVAATLTGAVIKGMVSAIPLRLRRLGVDVFGPDEIMLDLLDDTNLTDRQKNPELSEEAMRTGQIAGRIWGATPYTTDAGVIPNATISAVSGPVVLAVARGMLGYGFQKNPSTEQERDARARLTRIVGTMIHGEGVMESAGIVAVRISG